MNWLSWTRQPEKSCSGLPFRPAAFPVIRPPCRRFLDPGDKAQISFTGLAFSPDGSRIYLSNVNGDIKVFGVDQRQQGGSVVFHSAAAGQRAGAHE